MSVGAFIDCQGRPTGPTLEALTGSLADGGLPMTAADMSVANVEAFVASRGLAGLVLVTRDQHRGWQIGQEAMRRAGADPFALKVLDPADLSAPTDAAAGGSSRAALLVAGAAAMVREYPRLRPANIRLRPGDLSGHFSRRALLTVAKPRYEAIVAVDEARCAASRGCDRCFRTCPVGAVTLDGAVARIDKKGCRDCGICVPACPTGAIDHPHYRRQVMDAGLAALLAGAPADRGMIIAFVCGGAMDTLREATRRGISCFDAVLPVAVPSAAYLDLYLVLRAFDLGAEGVAVLSSEGDGPEARQTERSSGRLGAIQRVLDALGLGDARFAIVPVASARQVASQLDGFAERVAALPAHVLCRELPVPPQVHRFETGRLLSEIARRVGIGGALPVQHPDLPFGLPEFDAERCSLCSLCADACPTGALSYSEDGGSACLSFAGRDCTGCGLCSSACPEDALEIVHRLDASSLSEEPIRLKHGGLVPCHRCGRTYGPAALVERVLSQLGDRAPAWIDRYCPDCRMMAPSQGVRLTGSASADASPSSG